VGYELVLRRRRIWLELDERDRSFSPLLVDDLTRSLGSTADQIIEQPAGGSGLQSLGNGYYQYNWKSPAPYAKSCKTLKLDLGEGTGARVANFAFTK